MGYCDRLRTFGLQKRFTQGLLLFILLYLPFAPQTVFGQSSAPVKGYEIVQAGNYDPAAFETALQACKWDAYRKPFSRVELVFENGAVVSLLSGNELAQAGVLVNSAVMLPETYVRNEDRVFALHPNGYIYEKIEVSGVKH